jgi:cell shape-determining protein MreC
LIRFEGGGEINLSLLPSSESSFLRLVVFVVDFSSFITFFSSFSSLSFTLQIFFSLLKHLINLYNK